MKVRPIPGIPELAYDSAQRMLSSVKDGRIKQHLLGTSLQTRYGLLEAQSVNNYVHFLKSRLGYDILQLKGEEHHELD